MKKKNNIIISILTLMMALTLIQLATHQVSKNLSVREFYEVMSKYEVSETVVTPRNTVVDIEGVYKEKGRSVNFSTRIVNNEDQVKDVMEKLQTVDKTMKVADPNQSSFLSNLLLAIIPYVIMGGLMFFIFSKMAAGSGQNRAFDFGKSQAKIQGDIKVRFDDVAGAEEEKEEMQELIEYLKYPKKFEEMGALIPKGMLLVGPPGQERLYRSAAGEAYFHSIPFPVQILWKCLLVLVLAVFVICLKRLNQQRHVSSLLMRLMLWAVNVEPDLVADMMNENKHLINCLLKWMELKRIQVFLF